MATQATQRKSRTAASSISTSTTSSTKDSSTSSPASLSSSPPSFLDRLHRLIDRNQSWEKADLLDTIYWLRQALAVVVGPMFGLAGVTGSTGMVIFLVLLLVGLFGWYGKYQQVDVEELGSWQLMSEGSWPAFALFVVSRSRTTHQPAHTQQYRSIHTGCTMAVCVCGAIVTDSVCAVCAVRRLCCVAQLLWTAFYSLDK